MPYRKGKNDGLLPVLIIPGFMSSALDIQETTLHPRWAGKRIWVNFASLGFQSLVSSSETKQQMSKAQHYDELKRCWLQHIQLRDDMQTEPPGIKVRSAPGLEGVDFLPPKPLTNFYNSYLFRPVIDALVKVGYIPGVNLDAATYDWRLSPTQMEERDGYFTNTIVLVERLYKKNQMPVVLLCHSLGCKVGHYFLNYSHLSARQCSTLGNATSAERYHYGYF
jgi:hypothetical protein